MTTLADRFAAELADLKRRSDETDRRMAETIARMHGHIAELRRLDKALLEE